MKRKPRQNDQNILEHYISLGFAKINKYTSSTDPVDKLIELNLLGFTLVFGFLLSNWFFKGETIFSIDFIIILAIFIALSAILAFFYSFLLEPLVNASNRNISGLRLSVVILFLSLTFVISGLLFKFSLLTNIALGLVAIQLFSLFFWWSSINRTSFFSRKGGYLGDSWKNRNVNNFRNFYCRCYSFFN